MGRVFATREAHDPCSVVLVGAHHDVHAALN